MHETALHTDPACCLPEVIKYYNRKLLQDKSFTNWWKINICRTNFRGLLTGATKRCHAPKFRRENFHKSSKFVKVSPWKVSHYTVVYKAMPIIVVARHSAIKTSVQHYIMDYQLLSLNDT